MELLLNIVLIVTIFLSFIPVISLYRNKEEKKFKCLKLLITTTFAWTIIMIVERLIDQQVIMYYLHITSYPLKFLLSASMFCTIFDYINKKVPKPIFVLMVGFLVLEIIVTYSNEFTMWMFELSKTDATTLTSLYVAKKGLYFYFHLVITYSLLVSGLVYLFLFLRKHKNNELYNSVTKTMTYSSIIVLLFNAVQLTIIKTNVDLTYISLVIVVYILYKVIYSNDMIFNLRTSGRGEILMNMREMYILTDKEKNVVEISPILSNKYEIDIDKFLSKKLNVLMEKLEKQVVFYTTYHMTENDSEEKDHLHVREKKFTLKGLNTYGYMVLLYDETQVFHLLRELNHLSNFDQMTGLNNRNYFEKQIEHIDASNTGVISLDLNGLKTNNDYLGHERGDYLLKKLAGIMKNVTADTEDKKLARIGGDEFIIILNDTNKETVSSIKNKILKQSYNVDVLETISVSIGVSYNDTHTLSIYELIQNADQNMYQMKQETSKEYSKEIIRIAKKDAKYMR